MKTYEQPKVEVIELENESNLCQSSGTFSLEEQIGRGNDSDWGENLDW